MITTKTTFITKLFLLSIIIMLISCEKKAKEQNDTIDKTAMDSTSQVEGPPKSARPVEWSYEDNGPDKWGNLSPVYAACGTGHSQSPIDIRKTKLKTGANLNFAYVPSESFTIAHNNNMENIVDNGHTIQVTVEGGSVFTFGQKAYNLKQFHFHTPSEHTIDGKHLPMEMHMVHQSEDGSLAVVSILVKEGKTKNKNFENIITNLPSSKGESKDVKNSKIDLTAHIPKNISAYHYIGSLTTPPCTEDVQWVIMEDMISLTTEEIKAFSSRIGKNNRPVQKLYNRKVALDNFSGTTKG